MTSVREEEQEWANLVRLAKRTLGITSSQSRAMTDLRCVCLYVDRLHLQTEILVGRNAPPSLVQMPEDWEDWEANDTPWELVALLAMCFIVGAIIGAVGAKWLL